MDEIVKAALRKWPHVPSCTGWLGLDARGQWWMRDDLAQACGSFSSGRTGAKGAMLRHENLTAFIARNYLCDQAGQFAGQWYFQNGPQRVYVELEVAPWVWRVQEDFSVYAHTGVLCQPRRCVLDEMGCLYLETERGLGLVHSLDVLTASYALERGLWSVQEMPRVQLPIRFGYVCSPQQAQKESANPA